MNKQNKNVAIWLFVCCAMVAVMVLVGGVTRLTDSGLSMTNWKPVTGWFPPITVEQWAEEFAGYQASPEYKHLNYGMELSGFKSIFWLEYTHRLMGRITGLIFFIPLIYFLFRKAISARLGLGLAGVLSLGGTQGVVGWLMVSSGLKDAPHVSQYWLAFHLSMAFIIFSILFLFGLFQYRQSSAKTSKPPIKFLTNFSLFITVLIFIQVIMGAFVAGLDAGLVYNSFPKMDGQLIPNGLFGLDPWYMSVFDDIKTVQFTHRVVAFMLSFSILVLWLASKFYTLTKLQRCSIACLLLMVFAQFGLGVFTLIHVVPISLASAHQMGALALFATSLYVNYSLIRV